MNCSFCLTEADGLKLIQGPSVQICSACLTQGLDATANGTLAEFKVDPSAISEDGVVHTQYCHFCALETSRQDFSLVNENCVICQDCVYQGIAVLFERLQEQENSHRLLAFPRD